MTLLPVRAVERNICCWNTFYRFKEIIIVIVLLILSFHYFVGIPRPPLNSLIDQVSSLKDKVIPLKEVIVEENTEEDEITFVENNLSTLEMDDPRFLRYVRARYFIPPNVKGDYNLIKPQGPFATAHSTWVRNYLKDKRDGIFIEAGANSGELESHTLELEKELGWTGILVECNPTVVPYLRSKHRKAWVAGVCLSKDQHFAVFNFSNPESWTYSGRVGAAWNLPVKTNWTYFDVESIPFYSVIAAVGYKEIDYLSLDVEGLELDILKAFPFEKITIKLMIVEIYFLTEVQRSELTTFLATKGFELVHKFGIDYAYAHESIRNS